MYIYGLGFKIHKLCKDREKFYWKLSCLASCKKKALCGYVHLVFAFQTRSRLKYKQMENKVLKKILISTTLQSLYFLHLMKGAFASRHFSCFDCQSRILHFAIWLLFLLVSFDWSVGQNAPWMNQNCFVVTWLMTYVCLHILHPHQKKKYIKKLSNILLTDSQQTWGGNLTDFNFLRSISTFCTQKN